MDYFNFKGVASRLYYKNQSAMPISKVAVIGAGPAGLCALRHMLGSSYNGILSPIAFERNARIGGVWLYTNDTNKVPLHSAVYDNMRWVGLCISMKDYTPVNVHTAPSSP